jgi:hypothetical protein
MCNQQQTRQGKILNKERPCCPCKRKFHLIKTKTSTVFILLHSSSTTLYIIILPISYFQYYSEAYGQFILLLGAVGTIFQLPLRNHWKYRGVRTEIWLPSTFYEYKPEQRTTTPHVLSLSVPSGSSSNAIQIHKKENLQAVAFLERSAAVAVSAHPELAPRRSLVAFPLEWIADVCDAAMREKTPQKGASDQLNQSVLIIGRNSTPDQDEAVAIAGEDREDSETLTRGGKNTLIIDSIIILSFSPSYLIEK